MWIFIEVHRSFMCICDRDEDHVHVDGDKGPYNEKNIIHYRMSY